MLRALRSAVMAALVLAAVACASPTLPLPPPAVPSVSPSMTDPTKVHLVSNRGAEPNALIVVINFNLPLSRRVGGAQADANGSWDAEVTASRGDVLQVTQEFGTTRSAPVDVQVP